MRIKLKTLWATPVGIIQPDSIIDVDDHVARELIYYNQAEAASPEAFDMRETFKKLETEMESGMLEPEEKAIVEPPKPRGKGGRRKGK